ncbi:ATP-binding protein [Sporolactobacillus spathodeae]|uniref:histidine kinase n=1 Tax=Sporolactobacillus spathodeae TaxID=1465502 RepID=A0ABS2Q6A4_9BACL|nr:ATP-binding protein [Sporolactobacillus spathodeae]MBM7657295.1 PAS domain S-box-containing protein [Sporolactobacillus spathodeae]
MRRELSQLNQLDPNLIHARILYVYDEEKNYLDQLVDAVTISLDAQYKFVLFDTRAHYKTMLAAIEGKIDADKLKQFEFIESDDLIQEMNDRKILNLYYHLIDELFTEQTEFRLWISCATEDSERVNNLAKLTLKEDFSRLMMSYGWSVYAFPGKSITALHQNRLKKIFNFFMNDNDFVRSNLYRIPEQKPYFIIDKSNQRIEKKLNLTRRNLESLINNYVDPIKILDEEDKVILVNDAYTRLLHWPKDELLGLPYSKLPCIPEERRFEIRRDRSFTLIGQSVQAYQTQRLRKRDARLVDVTLTSFPLMNMYRRINGRAVILRDTTEKNNAIAAFLKTEQLSTAGDLAEGIARELLQPITSIKGFAQLLEREDQTNSGYFAVINSEIDRVVRILRELLSFSEPKFSTQKAENLISLLNEVILFLEPQARIANVRIVFDAPTEIFFVDCDRSQMKQAFINYIKNAIEAMPKGGILTIVCKQLPGRQLSVTFTDQGVGVPKEFLSKIGNLFFTTKENGTGLGFSVSKRIVETFHGTVKLFSKENVGTTIQLIFPSSGTIKG